MSDRPVLAMPPRPDKRLPPLKLLRTAATNTLGIFDEALFEQPVVVRRYGLITLAFVSDPAGIRQVLVDKFSDYPRLPVIRRLYAAEIGTGTLATTGEIWARHRRIVAPTLDRRAIAPSISSLIASANAAASLFDDEPTGAAINVEKSVSRMWLQLLNQMVTGGDPRAIPILTWLGKVPRKPRALDLLPMPARLRSFVSPATQSPERAALREQLLGLIQERLVCGYAGPQDFLWRIAHGVDRQTGLPLPLAEMRDEASSQLAAGEASVRALTWIWYLLALHPDVEAKLHAELDIVLGEDVLQPDHLKQLVYTRRVLDEVIRLYPPIPVIVRQAQRADVIGGLRVPRRAIVIVSPYVVHRHRRLWSDPDVFDPDRFQEDKSMGRPRFAYIPFSAGPGVCTGSSFAMMQMMIVVAILARRYRFHLASHEPISAFGGISLQPRGGLWMRVERR